MRKLSKAPLPFRGTEVHTLPNGLTVLLKQDPTVPVVALQVWARCGAVDEHATSVPLLYSVKASKPS